MLSLTLFLAAAVGAAAGPLEFDRAGHLVKVAVGGDVVSTGAQPGGFSLRDGAKQDQPELLGGTVAAAGDGVRFEGRNQAGELAVGATLTFEAGVLVIRGEVRNLSRTEHAVSLSFTLPVALDGWSWGTRLHRSEPLAEGRVVHLGQRSPLGAGYLSLRPIAAINDSRHTLGLAVPMDAIRQYDFVADVPRGAFTVTTDFAITKDCPKFFERVPFEFHMMAEPNGWGLRAALARWYSARPQWFRRELSEAGGWFAWGDILRQPAPLCDYGLKFHEQPESADGWQHDVALGIQIFPYIEQGMYQMCFGDYPRAPTREEILARIHAWAKPEATGRLASGGFPTQELLQRICQALLASGTKSLQGEPVIGSVGQYPWISGSRWAVQFPLNLSPDIPDGAGQVRLDEVRGMLKDPRLSGIYLDSYSGHQSRLNYAKDQLKWLRYPPLFEAESKQPCDLAGFSHWAWVDALSELLPPGQRALLPNLYNQPIPFPWHRFAVFGKENWLDPAGPLMQQCRAMADHKVVTQLPAYEDASPQFLRNLLLLDVLPGGYARHTDDPPQGMRATYRVIIPLLRLLDKLGWEPLTQARPTSVGLQLERYGSAPGPVAVAVRNPYAEGIAKFEVDAGALGLPPDAWVADVVTGAPVESRRDGATLQLALGLPSDDTTVLVLGDAAAHATWDRLLADDGLNDARLCLTEDGLREQAAHPAVATLAPLTSASTPAALAAAAQSLTGTRPTEARARELLAEAARLVRDAAAPVRVPSKAPVAPPRRPGAGIPWHETFDRLEPAEWRLEPNMRGVRVNGRLEMELPRDARTAQIQGLRGSPFVPRAILFECDFKYTHGPHEKYLMQSILVTGNPSGGGDFLRLRIEGKQPGVIRVENQESPATNWQYTLTTWKQFDSSKPHHLKLRLDQLNYRLELDGELVGEGPHGCDFGVAYFSPLLSSGHMGHGDVCWFDNFQGSWAE